MGDGERFLVTEFHYCIDCNRELFWVPLPTWAGKEGSAWTPQPDSNDVYHLICPYGGTHRRQTTTMDKMLSELEMIIEDLRAA